MLQLVSITECRENVYLVTLDRDGKILEYEFTRTPPNGADGYAMVGYPDKAAYDLIDYEPEESKNKPGGAIWIPALSKVNQIIHRIANGARIDYPVLLDER